MVHDDSIRPWVTARALLRGIDTRTPAGIGALALVAALVMTAWDTVMDPGMAAAGNWIWEKGGPYFGVPLRKLLWWLLTTFLVYCGAGLILARHSVHRLKIQAAAGVASGLAVLPIVVYAVHGIRYVTAGRILALHVVALFAMVLPGLVALMQTWMTEKVSDAAGHS